MKKYEILFLSSYAPMDLADLLSGIVSLRESHGCNVHIIGDIASRKTLKRLLEFWSPDGCIIHCGLRDDCFVPADFGRIPTVWLDRDPASLPPGSLCVMQDARSVGRIAAKELLKYDLESYAFVDRPDPQFWSKGRRDAFKEAVDLNGRAYFEFGEKRRNWWSQKLPGFLSSLPRPAGVFCSNDIVAADVISAVTRLGIAIPDDMAVVGVDDVEVYCESLTPTLTSVRPFFGAEGSAAADMLVRKLTNPKLKGVVKAFEAREITRRQSTRRITTKGGNMDLALELIRRRAAEGVTVDEVVALMGCSRRAAELRFRQYLHSTILDEIHAARVELAKKIMLGGKFKIGGLHLRCGFSSPATFRRVFRDVAGVSPRGYLASAQGGRARRGFVV